MPADQKPLGRKAYGSIPHLNGSRLGPADHSVSPGQDRICTVAPRDKHDRIIVTEKLDGSNVAVANVDGSIVALGRAGYLAVSSPHEQHRLFDLWVGQHARRFQAMLQPGERVNGEWLALAHGTKYKLTHEPFVAFDMMVGSDRLLWDEITARCAAADVTLAYTLSDGPSVGLDELQGLIAESHHGAIEDVEGAVWRVERKGKVDFLAKWVRQDKVDGKYLADIFGGEPIWHWQPQPEAEAV